MGSKSKIAEHIINILPSGERFVDLFGGGFAMSHCALLSNKFNEVFYNEINPLLVPLIKDAIAGKYSYENFKPPFISRQEFHERKDLDGYVKYCWSFGNNGITYMFNPEIEKQKRSLHNAIVFNEFDEFFKSLFPDFKGWQINDIKERRLYLKTMLRKQAKRIDLQQLEQLERLQQLEQLERLQLNTGSYSGYKYKNGDVVYCDPPYENTAKYTSKGFDHKEFYNWVYNADFPVWFSSYEISDRRFVVVNEKKKKSLLNVARKTITEKIYTNKKAFEISKNLHSKKFLF